MFDFFRKDKGSPKPVVPDPEPQATVPLDNGKDNGVEVEELDVQLVPEVEEAVVLYSGGHTAEATAALHRYILNHPDNRDPQPWRMLFDIYELTGQHQPFEDLAMDYAVRLEQSPPTWRPAQVAHAAPTAGDHPSFAFGANLSPQDKVGLEHFLRECETAESVELEFHKTPVPGNDAYARALLDCVARLARGGKPVRLAGGEAFVVRLDATRTGGQLSEPLWLLLLLLLQMQGKAEMFDEVAIDYAVRFEISPPSYMPPKVVLAEPEAGPEAVPSDQVFPMRGLIDPGSAAVFDQLRQFAAPLPRVVIDLAEVSRIDFMVVGLLMDAVMNLTQAGKQVLFTEANEMTHVLLQMVGVGQLAGIQPKKRK
jgi:anti-anti-sigma regulatory factor